MKIGLLSDVRNNSISDQITLWTLAKFLKTRGVMPVIIDRKQTEKQGDITFDAGQKKSSAPGISEFMLEQFTICAAQEERLKEYGLYRQMESFLVTDADTYEALCKTGEDKERNLVFLEHPLMLGNQMSLHGISEKPELTAKYVFAHLCHRTPERDIWVDSYARSIGATHVICYDGVRVNRIELLKDGDGLMTLNEMTLSAGEYLGYLWQSEAVITDAYCTVALAALHEKEFAVFPAEEEKEQKRITELLQILKLSGHEAEKADLNRRYLIQDSAAFRNALHTYREKVQGELEEKIQLSEGKELVSCPVHLAKAQCMGCEACAAVCPENAIRMEADHTGYRYPVVDTILCNECDWCSDVCVKRGKSQSIYYAEDKAPDIYVGEAREEEGYTAYSGLYKKYVDFVLNERDGMVFGTVFNESLEPVIVGTTDAAVAMQFAEQRYLKAHGVQGFRQIRKQLEEDRFVMFAGLPCECAGLKSYLKKQYPKLFLCEFFCHSVVSETLFSKYLNYLRGVGENEIAKLHFGKFPAKSMEEAKVLQVKLKNGESRNRKYASSQYIQLIRQFLSVREGCANCSYGAKKRVGDVTFGELLEIHSKKIPAKWKNYSILMANTQKGIRVQNRMSEQMTLEGIDYEKLFEFQYRKTAVYQKEQIQFFKRLEKQSFTELTRKK